MTASLIGQMQSEIDIWFEHGSVPFQNECILEMTNGLNFEIINSLIYTSRVTFTWFVCKGHNKNIICKEKGSLLCLGDLEASKLRCIKEFLVVTCCANIWHKNLGRVFEFCRHSTRICFRRVCIRMLECSFAGCFVGLVIG